MLVAASSPHAGDLLAAVAPVLVGSPFECRSRWPHAVVVLRGEGKRVTSRGDFAGWLAANDLGAKARECTTRKVLPGHVLCWVEVDTSEVAAAEFRVLDVVGALRASA